MKSSKFKLVLLLSTLILILCCSITANAATGDPAKPDKILKYTIGDDAERHELKSSGTDNIVTFTLPSSLNENSYWIADYMEVMILEKVKGDIDYSPMEKIGSSEQVKTTVGIEGLEIELNLGNSSNYRTGAQYQIAYRVHMTGVDDQSLSMWNIPTQDYIGAGYAEDVNDPNVGWTLLTDNGAKFIIYTNSDPTGEVTHIIKRETVNVKPAVDPATLGGSPKVAITKSVGNLTMQARQHFHQPYAQDYRIYTKNYSSVSNGTYYTDVIRAYSANEGSTTRQYKWYVTDGSKLNSSTPLNRSAIVSTSNAAQPSATSAIVTNSSGWDGMGNDSGTETAYIMMDLVSNSGTQDAYTLTDIEYRIGCGTDNSNISSSMSSAIKGYTEDDDGYGNWAKTCKYLSGVVNLKDEDEGDMLGFKVLINGTSYSNTTYTDFEVYDSGNIIYPGASFEYQIDLASKLEEGVYTYTIVVYDDNGGDCEFINEAVGGYITLVTDTYVKILGNSSQQSADNETKWANTPGSVDAKNYKTFTVRLNGYTDAKKLIGGNDNVKVRTQYTMYNVVENDVDNRYYVSRSTMLGMDIDNDHNMRNYYIDKALTTTEGRQWKANYNENVNSTTTRLLSHANSWKHDSLEETTMYEDGLYSLVASCNDIYGNYIEKVYSGQNVAIRIDGHAPEIMNVDSSIPLNSVDYSDNSELEWVKQPADDDTFDVVVEDAVASIAGIEYYSGVKDLCLEVTTLEGSRPAHAESFSYDAELETTGDMMDISNVKRANFDVRDSVPREDGIFWFAMIASDLAGNKTDLVDRVVAIDGTAPTIDPLSVDIEDNGFEMINNNDNSDILDRNPSVDYVTDWVDYVPGMSFGVRVQDITSGIESITYGVSNEIGAMTSAWNTVDLSGDDWLETETVDRDGIANLNLGNCGTGIKYLHVKAIDRAGNESSIVIKLKLNSIPEIDSITVDDTSRSGIYKTLEADVAPNGIKTYIVYKSADYSAFRVNILDADVDDKIEIKYTMTNNETGHEELTGTHVVEGPQNGTTGVAKAFMVNYQDELGNDLPDGIYTLTVEYTDIKSDSDYDGIEPYNGEYKMPYREGMEVPTVQVVLKRTQPPVPQITVDTGTDASGVDCKIVTIEYPPESGVLNCPELNALILEKYSTSTRRGAMPFIDYTGEFYVYETTNVVAQYTDCAGNISTNSLQVLMEGLPDPEDDINISEGGSDVVVDQTRASNTYYIGTRKENDAGINSSEVFSFID